MKNFSLYSGFWSDISGERLVSWFVYFLLGSIPLLFGAVHPMVAGVYSALMLVFCGGWLLMGTYSTDGVLKGGVFSFWLIIPLILIGYVAFQSVPLPVPVVELLSPLRAERMEMVANLGEISFVSISLSDCLDNGFYQALTFLALLFYYFSLRYLFKSSAGTYMGVLYIIAILGAFEAFYGLLQFVKPHIGTLWLTSYGRGAHGTIIYKNQFASFMNMVWPLVFALGLLFLARMRKESGGGSDIKSLLRAYSGAKLQAPLFMILGGFIVLAVIFSLSRGGILSCLFTVLLLAVLLPFSVRVKLIFFLLFFTIILGYGALLGWDTILTRFETVDNSAAGRMSIYLSSLQMMTDHWLTGIGMGAYELLSAVYIKWLPVTALADRAHCEYLELLIELGVPMATLLFIWIIAGMFVILRSLRAKEKDSPAAIIGVAAWCGLMSFLLHGCIDFGWRLPANLFYAVTLLALATGSEAIEYSLGKLPSKRQRKQRNKKSLKRYK